VIRPRRLATVDLGTNTVRLLVVEADDHGNDGGDDGAWRALHQTQRVTRLGEGQASEGRLLLARTAAAVADRAAPRAPRRHPRPDRPARSKGGNRREFVARLEADGRARGGRLARTRRLTLKVTPGCPASARRSSLRHRRGSTSSCSPGAARGGRGGLRLGGAPGGRSERPGGWDARPA
jgi:hypothetical protein